MIRIPDADDDFACIAPAFSGSSMILYNVGDSVLTGRYPLNPSADHRFVFRFSGVRSAFTVLDHYYHFVAELFLGTWAFWNGAFNATIDTGTWTSSAPSVNRAIFGYNPPEGIRDRPGFNPYFLRSAFPSLTVESERDWADRMSTTIDGDRAFHFDIVLIADRSAAFKGKLCGETNQRIASEAYEPLWDDGRLQKEWWEPVRREVLRFAGVKEKVMALGIEIEKAWEEKREKAFKAPEGDSNALPVQIPIPIVNGKVVITYISRQAARRHLIPEDHQRLVASLQEMSVRRGYELIIIEAEKLSKDEQIRVMARTTVWYHPHAPTYFEFADHTSRSFSAFTETAFRTCCGWPRPDI